jgi:hypothetical protein
MTGGLIFLTVPLTVIVRSTVILSCDEGENYARIVVNTQVRFP